MVIGFFSAVPVAGPISALILRRAIKGRTRNVKGIAAGSALAEAIYVFLALWGFGSLFSRYDFVTPLSKGFGALILTLLGLLFVFKPGKPVSTADELADAALEEARLVDRKRKGFVLGFGITALNPTLIATWSAGATTLYSSGLITYSISSSALFATGVAAGVTAWFLVLLKLVRRHHGKLDPCTLAHIQRAVGAVLLAAGAWFAWSFAAYYWRV